MSSNLTHKQEIRSVPTPPWWLSWLSIVIVIMIVTMIMILILGILSKS